MNQEQEKTAAIILAAKATKAAHRHSPPDDALGHAAAILWRAYNMVVEQSKAVQNDKAQSD